MAGDAPLSAVANLERIEVAFLRETGFCESIFPETVFILASDLVLVRDLLIAGEEYEESVTEGQWSRSSIAGRALLWALFS